MNDLIKKKDKIIAVVGPTAVGKTDIAIRIAQDLKSEIISADSMQIYKYMDIGSAKPTSEEREKAFHYLVDEIDPKKSFSVADYKSLAKKYISIIISKGKIPIISGGTGLYLHSLLYPMNFGAATKDDTLRTELKFYFEKNGKNALYGLLLKEDPESAKRIHPNNVKKVIRAIESARNGCKIKSFNNTEKEMNYDALIIGLTRNREKLYDRINKRVDIMMEKGLLDEVKGLMDMGLDETMNAMAGIGYKEVIGFFNGKYDLEEMITLIKKNSRHYAKRQLSWFRRYPQVKWFNIDENIDFAYKDIFLEIELFLKN